MPVNFIAKTTVGKFSFIKHIKGNFNAPLNKSCSTVYTPANSIEHLFSALHFNLRFSFHKTYPDAYEKGKCLYLIVHIQNSYDNYEVFVRLQ
jgi:hypothetical protein